MVIAATVAIVWANSPFDQLYLALLDVPIVIQVGGLKIGKPLLLWVNDGLMAVFFLLVGLEIKREILEGELADLRRVVLPGVAAIAGMALPAVIYLTQNPTGPTRGGWAIPMATDIAFALGVLALLGARAPASLKLFLLAIAIIDDLGAIVIIALVYTEDLSGVPLALAGVAIVTLVVLNRAGCTRIAAYILVGVFLWVCVLKSGVHATLAGIVVGLAVPLGDRNDRSGPLHRLEHSLHPWVAFGILPVFALANAGVSLAGLSPSALLDPVPLGIALGLFLGKQLGVAAASWLSARLGFGALPEGATWLQVYGVAALTGIGFTMSLFIGTLAFAEPGYAPLVRIGVLAGSVLSALVGYLVLYLGAASNAETESSEP